MATGKGTGGNKGKGGMDWSAGVRPSVVQQPNDSSSSHSHVQGYLSAIVVVMCIVLMLLIPVLAVMWGDLNAALVKTEYLITKMQTLREQIIIERRKFLEEKTNERTNGEARLDDH
jgi:hypothetical protein